MKNKIITLLTMIIPYIVFAEELQTSTVAVASIPLLVAVIAFLIFAKPIWFIAKAITKVFRFLVAIHPVKCRTCGYTSRGETICPNCGADLTNSDSGVAFLTGAGTFVLFIFRLVIFTVLEFFVVSAVFMVTASIMAKHF